MMGRFRTAAIWLLMLTKRLYKKPSFLLILILIPALVLGYRASANTDSGMMRVALVMEGDDPLSLEVSEKLLNSGQLLRCRLCDMETGLSLLSTGKVNALWQFPADLQGCVRKFVDDPSSENAFVQVLVRKDDIALQLSREKISGVLFDSISRFVYLDRLREIAPELNSLSDEALLGYYEDTYISGELFDFGDAAQIGSGHYLLSPLRGLLGIVAVLAALATAMYYIADCRRGTFARVSHHHQPIPELACQIVSVLHIVLVAWLCLAISGLAGSFFRELLTALLYTLCCAAFAMALRSLLGSVSALGVLLPVLIALMLSLCPVFFDFPSLRQVQYLFPPTYYVGTLYSADWLPNMAIYTLICFGVCILIRLIRKKQ